MLLLCLMNIVVAQSALTTLNQELINLNNILIKTPSMQHEQNRLSPRADFFEDIIGADEETFLSWYINKPSEIRKRFFIETDNNWQRIIISTDGKRYKAGLFLSKTLENLQKQSEAYVKSLTVQTGSFSVIEAINPFGTAYHHQVDIGAMQANPVWRNAVFQVASNFSALEPTSPKHLPEYGISSYVTDKTQGPFASISAAPGLIYRMYCMFFDRSKPTAVHEWRQTAEHQINLLEKTTTPVQNGYIVFTDNYLKNNKIDEEYSNIQIGYHTNLQVTFGGVHGSLQEVVTDPQQIIHQVFTAAVDFGSTNFKYRKNSEALHIAQKILDAAYEGTLRAAAADNKKKVVLTLIGGGVFDNSLSSIVNAIIRMQDFIKKSGLAVTLVIYDSTRFGAAEFKAEQERLLSFVKETGGKYVQYSLSAINGKILN